MLLEHALQRCRLVIGLEPHKGPNAQVEVLGVNVVVVAVGGYGALDLRALEWRQLVRARGVHAELVLAEGHLERLAIAHKRHDVRAVRVGKGGHFGLLGEMALEGTKKTVHQVLQFYLALHGLNERSL